MSNDIAAVKRLLTNLKTVRTKAIKAAAADKAAREERTRELLRLVEQDRETERRRTREEVEGGTELIHHTCPECGANLDPGESCDCQDEKEPECSNTSSSRKQVSPLIITQEGAA